MIRQIGALTLVVTLSIVGLPVTVHAEGKEQKTVPSQRVLTWHGQPLSEVLGTSGNAITQAEASGGVHSPVILIVAQGQTGQQRAEETQGMSRSKKVWLGVGIGAATGAALGAYAGVSYCRNEGGINCDSGQAQAQATGIFTLIGVGIGAGIGALLP